MKKKGHNSIWQGGHVPRTFLLGGGGGGGGLGQWYVCAPTFNPILYKTDILLFGIFHIPINYLVDNFNKLTQMAVSK